MTIPGTIRNTETPIVEALEAYLSRFVHFADSDTTLPVALWILATYVWPDFDAFPYVVITSATKRSGKTRLAELMGFTSNNPVQSGALSPAAIYKTMADDKPTIFFDEAETLNSESASVMRSVLNMGYRRGQVIRRMLGNEAKDYQTYCPKVFILIGDVYDTLKDRSIIVRMRRGEPRERFSYEVARGEGQALRDRVTRLLMDAGSIPTASDSVRSTAITYSLPDAVAEAYADFKGIEFLTDRDEEIWTPLFLLCKFFAPARMTELSRIATDMATEKTQDATKYHKLLGEGAEQREQDDYYAKVLLRDLARVINGAKVLSTAAAIEALRALPTAPWRKYRGDGLSVHSAADMLARFGVRPVTFRPPGGRHTKTMRGYRLEQVLKAMEREKVKP